MPVKYGDAKFEADAHKLIQALKAPRKPAKRAPARSPAGKAVPRFRAKRPH